MSDKTTIDNVFEKVKARIQKEKRCPVSTYRLQFNSKFTFRDAAALVPYLHELGITDIYASPYLKARAGSLHGYDITDYNKLNPELGSTEDYQFFISQLHKNRMGQILDFVPNHMSIVDNQWWTDVLENGQSSPYAQFFDIDWYPAKPELYGKILLPILEDQYGKVLESGQLRLTFKQNGFFIQYREHRLPVEPGTVVLPLQACLERLREMPGGRQAGFHEMQSIIVAYQNLPARDEIKRQRIKQRLQKKEVIKKRLWNLYQSNEKVRLSLNEVLDDLNNKLGDSKSFNHLHELLEKQVYRLSYWRVALDEVNFRRFFDVNELIAIRMENKKVFDLSHRLLGELLRQNAVTGLRIDHIDGLFAPYQYLWRLQEARYLDLCNDEIKNNASQTKIKLALREKKLLEKFEKERQLSPESVVIRPLFVVVEKILGEKEDLRNTWPVDGTTGYEFSNILNGIFIDKRKARKLQGIYRVFTTMNDDFHDIAYQCKNLIMETAMVAETNMLAHRLDRVSEKSRWYRDFTLNNLRDAIKQTIACFPIYRTYIYAFENFADELDKNVISYAIEQAKKRNPALSSSLFDFLHDTLVLKYPKDMSEEGHIEQQQFIMHFQQLTGPIMAKGVEDTAFYRYLPLVSLNDVGANPARFGNTIKEFHRHNTKRQRTRHHSLLATSTHDSKRSEDVRARINVLSEIPMEWKSALVRWSQINKQKKIMVKGQRIPDKNDEYLIYQILLGTYPVEKLDEEGRKIYNLRIQEYILKAIREAKVHTSWIDRDMVYEEGAVSFVRSILDPSSSDKFLTNFMELNKQVAYCGMYNSLAEVVLKIFSPGIPDFYQGNELWNYSLVDPDNRRPVDFAHRDRLLQNLKRRVAESSNIMQLAQELLDKMSSGEIKMYVTWRSLHYRHSNVGLFNEGRYIPIISSGRSKGNICAFAWRKKDKQILVIAPRLIAKLTKNGTTPPIGPRVWRDTELLISGRPEIKVYRDIFTGELVQSVVNDERTTITISKILANFPVAVLESISG